MSKKESLIGDGADSKSKILVVFRDGHREEFKTDGQIWPVGLFVNTIERFSCYPILDGNAHVELEGKLLTLIDAVIEDRQRAEAVKSLLRKEVRDWNEELRRSAVEIGHGGNSSRNTYTKRR